MSQQPLQGNGTSKVTEIIDGATGRGISANIRNAYSFISHNYNFDSLHSDQPDEIILVGFSRGAFAVQCLVSFLDDVGLLQSQDLYFLRGLFTLWSNQHFKRWGPSSSNPVNTKLQQYVPRMRVEDEVKLLHEVKIKALLAWGMVSALGLPVQVSPRPLSFVSKGVPSIVKSAFRHLRWMNAE
ncbi:hypothetical protein QBC36DRAFT_288748 [Triangularia setosa]|uniref:T6SS Phospholipase effector Tle1-like catalytic domain-containing protein n=1 Tax=Triangularia setosa TaxID=2587417 RepID=A0AAN6WAA3_9PEZI|nr:hypothetical protein QBC36DRAFT_288748 [Podospora setosa]